MKKLYILFILLTLLFTSCGSAKKLAAGGKIQDGKSFDTAVVITEIHETPGIHAEYQWIKNNYPGYKTRGQSLNYHNKKPFDVIHITTADSTETDVYFDISNFYGKF